MQRREFLAATGLGVSTGLSGCLGLFETRSALEPPLVEDRPQAVYIPTHVEGMEMVGMAEANGYRAALTYTYPHRFWLLTGTRRSEVPIKPSDDVHLMPFVWDVETGIVPPDVNPGLTVEQDDEILKSPAPWPMLSQPMGFHFGDNVGLNGDGDYTVTIDIGSPSIRRTGGMDPNRSGASFEFAFSFSQRQLEEIAYTDISSEQEGTQGAVDPMSMEMLPSTTPPPAAELPGTVLGTGTSGDADVILSAITDASSYGGTSQETYLVVSLRTPYNGYLIPMASVAATITRDGSTVVDTNLSAAIDPDLRYHYGTPISGIEAGDEVTIRFQTPSQVSRHEGYETAFIEMAPVTITA